MTLHPNSSEQAVLTYFREKKILTIDQLSQLLHCSPVTARRRLKQWRALTSYNRNNRYYALPSIPVFDKKGLWHYRGASFSKHGTCKQTVVHLVQRSEKGLSNTELAGVLGENPNSLMAHFKKIPGITKERHGRDIVYFSSDEQVYKRQRRNRFPPEPSADALPSDAQAILILVELIHHPKLSVDELVQQLRGKGHAVHTDAVLALFDRYGIKKN